MPYLDYSVEQLIEAVKSSFSIAEVCRKIGLIPRGGNYKTVSRKIHELSLDTSHFTGKNWNKNKYFPVTQLKSHGSIKKALLREHGNICWNCKLTEWMGKPITLELEHKNGFNFDNTITNLELLCPNCHSQTSTWKKRKTSLSDVPEKVNVNYKKRNMKIEKICDQCGKSHKSKKSVCIECRRLPRIIICPKCLIEFPVREFRQKFCSVKCANQFNQRSDGPLKISMRKVVDRPSKEELEKLVWFKPTSQIAKDFQVSDNAVAKWCKNYNISKPPRGYWAKNQG